jgi:hypothetical protein
MVIDCTVTGTVRLLCTVKTRQCVVPGYRLAGAPEHAGESKISLVTAVPVPDVRASFGDEGCTTTPANANVRAATTNATTPVAPTAWTRLNLRNSSTPNTSKVV